MALCPTMNLVPPRPVLLPSVSMLHTPTSFIHCRPLSLRETANHSAIRATEQSSQSSEEIASAVSGGSWEARRAVDRSERLMEDPFEPVEAVMSSPVTVATPDATVGEVLPHFALFTGLPVVDSLSSLRCVGILSNIDIARHQRRGSASVASATVGEVMTTPAFVILRHAPVAYAAGLMLKHKVHRLPVVDEENRVVGILTRTDIYEPLLPAVNPMLHRISGVQGWGEES